MKMELEDISTENLQAAYIGCKVCGKVKPGHKDAGITHFASLY